MRRYYQILVILIVALAQDVSAAVFKVDAPSQVIQGNKFNITYILENASGSDFKSAAVGGCKLLYGPSVSESMSSYNINGKVSSSSSESYTMTYRAEKAGRYNVGAASINVGGKIYKTKPFSLQVLPPDKSATSGRQSQSVQVYDVDSQTPDKGVGKNDVFVRIILSKSQAYEQEGLLCTIKLYTKYNIQQFMPTIQPSFNGFISQELPITSSINRIENYGGENYMVADLKQCILFPQQSGKLTINSGNYDLTVIQYEQVRSVFGMMRRPVEKKIKVKSNQASINIIPLPTPKPADFIGAVGSFTASGKLLNETFKTNESGTFRLVIKGNGNLKNIKSPQINFPSQFDVYDSETTVNANPSGDHLSGNVTIDYAFVPQYVGDFEIPQTSFSYFNTAKKKYEQVKVGGFKLHVEKGSSTASPMNKDNVQKDVRHIKLGDLSLVKGQNLYVYTWWYALCYIIPIIAFALILYYYRRLIKARSNIKLMKVKRANKEAVKRLKRAKKLMDSKQPDGFYEEVLRALWGYFSDKLVIPVSELNRDNISQELQNHEVSEESIRNAIDLLDECEFARYAKSENGGDMMETYKQACELINRIGTTKKK